jgi:hypothetical protein
MQVLSPVVGVVDGGVIASTNDELLPSRDIDLLDELSLVALRLLLLDWYQFDDLLALAGSAGGGALGGARSLLLGRKLGAGHGCDRDAGFHSRSVGGRDEIFGGGVWVLVGGMRYE